MLKAGRIRPTLYLGQGLLRGAMKTMDQTNRNERGASLVEYVILVAMIAMICIVSIRAFRNQVLMVTNNASDQIAGAGSGNPE